MADTASFPDRPEFPVRKRFTGEDVLAMMRAGIIEEGGPEELLDGDIWITASEGRAHAALKVWLNERLILGKPADVAVACDTSIEFAPNHTPSPDFSVFPSAVKVFDARGPDMLLVIEIADSSVQDDLAVKAPKYLEYGVAEYWVIDIQARATHVHLLSGDWPKTPGVPFEDTLAPAFAPELRLRLADSGI